MAKIVDNPKGFKVVEASRMELACKLGGFGICDNCNMASNIGYYVAVLNDGFAQNAIMSGTNTLLITRKMRELKIRILNTLK